MNVDHIRYVQRVYVILLCNTIFQNFQIYTSNIEETLQQHSNQFAKCPISSSWIHKRRIFDFLVGGFNPFQKYARQNGNLFPRDRGENKKYLSCHHLAFFHQKTTQPPTVTWHHSTVTCHQVAVYWSLSPCLTETKPWLLLVFLGFNMVLS